MGIHLIPEDGAANLPRLRRDFCYLPLNRFDAVDPSPGAVNPENPH